MLVHHWIPYYITHALGVSLWRAKNAPSHPHTRRTHKKPTWRAWLEWHASRRPVLMRKRCLQHYCTLWSKLDTWEPNNKLLFSRNSEQMGLRSAWIKLEGAKLSILFSWRSQVAWFLMQSRTKLPCGKCSVVCAYGSLPTVSGGKRKNHPSIGQVELLRSASFFYMPWLCWCLHLRSCSEVKVRETWSTAQTNSIPVK